MTFFTDTLMKVLDTLAERSLFIFLVAKNLPNATLFKVTVSHLVCDCIYFKTVSTAYRSLLTSIIDIPFTFRLKGYKEPKAFGVFLIAEGNHSLTFQTAKSDITYATMLYQLATAIQS